MSLDWQPHDVAAMASRVARRLGSAEEPLLAAHGLTMWEYVVLCRLERESASSQLTLAHEIRHDKSRLVALLDALEDRGLVQRDRDPADRRSRTVSITKAGRQVQRSVQAEIREMEAGVLSVLSPAERRAFVSALTKLSSVT